MTQPITWISSIALILSLASLTFACSFDKPVIIVGAGISGVTAGKYLNEGGCNVIIFESQGHLGGRMFSEKIVSKNKTWYFHHGANWIHGYGENPMYLFNKQENIVRTKWLPRTYLLRTRDGEEKYYEGTISAVPGDDIREDFEGFVLNRNKFWDWLAGTIDGTFASPDLPLTYHISEYIAERNLSGSALDEFLTFMSIYMTGMDANDLFKVGFADFFVEEFGDDREWLVGEPGYVAVVEHLAKGLDIRYNHKVSKIEYNQDGVKVHIIDTIANTHICVEGIAALVTVSVGVLQHDAISFEPELPLWKWKGIHGVSLGLLDKIFFVWDEKWFPQIDAFWRVKNDEGIFKSTASEWYNLHDPDDPDSAFVLLTTPAGYFAQIIESLSDEEVIDIYLKELKTIFPDIEIPHPSEMHRTKWMKDPNAFMSYISMEVGDDPVSPDILAESIGDRLFFAGEGTSATRWGFVDGAYSSGIREATKILTLLKSGELFGTTHFNQVPDLKLIRKNWGEKIKRLSQVNFGYHRLN